MEKHIKLIKRYLPDSLILLGILIFSYNYLRPATCSDKNWSRFSFGCDITNHHINLQILGIMLFATGLILAIRRYLSFKK